MGQYDTALKQYLNDEFRFADLINGVIGQGKQLVSAEQLEERDSQAADLVQPLMQTSLRRHRGKHKKILPKYRDLVRKAVFGVNFVVIGIENQDKTHYLMPLRCIGYEVREYERQAAKIGKKLLAAFKEKKIKLSDAEFLSRFRKEDRLHPCITLVLYFGDEWDGATSLRQLLDDREIPEEFQAYINEYRVHILHVKQLQRTDMFQSDLRLVFDSIRFADDKEKFRKYVLQNAGFQDLDDEAYCVIQQYSHSKELEELEEKILTGTEGGHVNMCKAITELIAEGREKGLEEGLEKGIEKGKREIVVAMYRNGMDREAITQVTSITAEELKILLTE